MREAEGYQSSLMEEKGAKEIEDEFVGEPGPIEESRKDAGVYSRLAHHSLGCAMTFSAKVLDQDPSV